MSKENKLAFLIGEVLGKLDIITTDLRKHLPQDILTPLDELYSNAIEQVTIILYANESKNEY